MWIMSGVKMGIFSAIRPFNPLFCFISFGVFGLLGAEVRVLQRFEQDREGLRLCSHKSVDR